MINPDPLLADLRKLVAVVRARHAETGTAGMPEALATMFHLLDKHITETGQLPAEWRKQGS